MLETLLQPFEFSFMINAFIIVAIISLPTAVLSCFLVLKGWSLMGDAISHAVLPGLILAYVLNIPLIIGAFFAGLVCSGASGFISDNCRVKPDAVLGVVFSGMFGLGVVLFTKINTDLHLDHILFGNILGISSIDIWISGIISVVVFLIIILRYKDLLIHSFDPIQARAVGLSVKVLHYLLLILISLTIVATLSSVGIILSIGLLIAPGSIAFLSTRDFTHMLFSSVLVTVLSCFFGVYLSFFFDSAPAPTIVLVLTFVFIITFLLSNKVTRHQPS